jgi:hypothetical protein
MKHSVVSLGWLIILLSGGVLGFNHPEIKWRSVVTDHFIIHYYDHTEPAVYAAWKIAEERYASLSGLYDVEVREKINLALADYDDYSNGFANWINAAIIIWIADDYFDLRGKNTWLQNVITHELAHIMTLKKRSGMQLLDWTLGLKYTSPSIQVTLSDPLATNMFWPQWFAEGLAQWEAQRAGNDGWDCRRDMLLRDAVLFSGPLSLEEMGHFNHNALGNELVYNQGFSFLTFLENRLGSEKMREIINDGRRTIFFSQHFYPFFYEHTGVSIEKLYGEWIDSVKSAGRRLLPQTQTSAIVLWNGGFFNSMPKLSRDRTRIGWLTNDGDDFSRTDLIVKPYDLPGENIRIPWAKQSWDFSPDGKKVYYIKSRCPNENGSFINELFVRNLENSRETRLVKNARAYDIALAPDNRSMAWIRYRDGVFSIVTCDLDGRDMATIIAGRAGEPFWRLSFDPSDPGKLATTRVIDGKAQLCVVDIKTKTVTPLTGADAQEESPFWAEDGRIYYSADYDGISNIYSVNSDGSDCLRHTSTSGGMFSPFILDDSTFVGAEYRNRGFTIVKGAMMQDSSFSPADKSSLSFKSLPKPKGKVSIRSSAYEPRLLRRVWELQTALNVNDPYGKIGDIGTSGASFKLTDSLSYSVFAGLFATSTDALEKRSSWFGLQIALQALGKTRDTSTTAEEERVHALVPAGMQPHSRFLSPESLQTSQCTPFQGAKTRVSRLLSRENDRSRSFATRSASSDTSGKRTVVPFFFPGIGWKSSEHALSLGLDLQCYLFNVVIPVMIMADGQAQWHILRDLYADFSPQIQFFPVYLLRFGQINGTFAFPLALSWSHSDYLNTDIAYNFRGRTILQGTITPAFFPIGQDITTDDGRDSISYHSGSSTSFEIQCSHGFPVLRYSSLVMGIDASQTRYSESIADPLDTLKGSSEIFATLGLSGEYLFPIARQINRGIRYADALYGALIYTVTFYSNSSAISGTELVRALSRQSYDSRHYFVEHSIGAGVTFGVTKNYEFLQTNMLSVLWNVWAQRISVNFSAGF